MTRIMLFDRITSDEASRNPSCATPIQNVCVRRILIVFRLCMKVLTINLEEPCHSCDQIAVSNSNWPHRPLIPPFYHIKLGHSITSCFPSSNTTSPISRQTPLDVHMENNPCIIQPAGAFNTQESGLSLPSPSCRIYSGPNQSKSRVRKKTPRTNGIFPGVFPMKKLAGELEMWLFAERCVLQP